MDEQGCRCNSQVEMKSISPSIRRIALLSVHSSPLGVAGGRKIGGMNIMVAALAKTLGRRGIKVDVFTREDDSSHIGQIVPIDKNARLIYLPAGPPEYLEAKQIHHYVDQFTTALLDFTIKHQLQYELVYSHYWISGAVALHLRDAWDIPIVQMFHTLGQMKKRIANAGTDIPPATLIPPPADQRVEVENKIIAKADRLIAATQAERVQMLMLYRADRRRIEIVPPGVDLDRFQPVSQWMAKKCLNIEPTRKLLVWAGRIEPLKGIDNILYALALIQKATPDLASQTSLFIVGGNPFSDTPDNEEMRRLQNLVRRLEIEQMVCFVGAKPQTELHYYFNAAEAVLVPSDYESFGMVALEAMACGTPVIASEVGGLAFLVKDGETGYHVPTRDPATLAERIYQITSNPEKRAQMGRAAQQQAKEYSWEHITDRLVEIFNEALVDRLPSLGSA